MTIAGDLVVLRQMLAGLVERFAGSCDQSAMTEIVLPAVTEALGASIATVALRVDQRTLRVVGATGMPREVTDPWAEFDLAAAVPLAASVRDGVSIWLSDVAAARRTYPAMPDPATSSSLCTIPLRKGGEVIGVLGVAWSRPREFDEPDRQLLTTVAGLVAAACELRPATSAPRLRRQDGAPLAQASISFLQLQGGARFAVHRARAGSRLGPTAVFATLLDANPELPPRTLDAVSGALGLCRRREVPPALVGQAIAEMSEDLDGPITGAHIEIAVDNGWAAVATLDGKVVISSSPGEGKLAPPSEERLAGERVLLASDDPAAIVVIALDVNSDSDAARRVADIAAGLTDPLQDSSAGDLIERLNDALHKSEISPCVRGAIAVVLDPRPDLAGRSRRLPAQPVSTVLGRWFAVATLPGDAPRDVSEDVELVTDELVANAIRHADRDVVITVTDETDGTKIAVSDDDDRVPDLRPVGEDAESGRGMAVIEALADDVGTSERAGGGKWVWARLRWRDGVSADHGSPRVEIPG